MNREAKITPYHKRTLRVQPRLIVSGPIFFAMAGAGGRFTALDGSGPIIAVNPFGLPTWIASGGAGLYRVPGAFPPGSI